MRKKVIQLPQGYLSYSQIALWKANKERYKSIYFDGRRDLRINNSGMAYGKVVATALEEEKDTGDLLTDSAMALLKQYDVKDKEIRAEIKTKEGWITVMGKPDTFNSKTHEFREFKTGKGKWTQGKAQKHIQMRMYAMLIYLKHGTVLSHAYLDWMETENTDMGIQPTGHVESFRVELGIGAILEMMALASSVAKEIEIAWASHVPEPKLTF